MNATRLVLVSVFAVSAILLASPVAGALGSSTGQPTATQVAPAMAPGLFHHLVEKKFYHHAYGTLTLASVGPIALSVLSLDNGSEQVILFNAVRDSSHVVQAVLPGGPLGFVITEIAAGGNFFLQCQNLALNTVYFEEITPQGAVSTPALPLPLNGFASLIGGSWNALFAGVSNSLISINPWTFAIQANYTALLPPNVGVSAILPAGPRLYLGGSLAGPSGGSAPFFGFIDTSSNTETTLSSPTSNNPQGLYGVIDTIAQSAGVVYYGGYLQLFEPILQTNVGGYLFEYCPHTGTVTNLSSLKPINKWGVFAAFNIGPTVVMTIGGYLYNLSGLQYQVSGTYVLSLSHNHLINDSGLIGSNFAALYLETSLTAGIFFVGGVDLKTNVAEIVAVPAVLFEPW
ncbi:MAG: hypothetical protein ACLP8Y_09945 [Thermoplasmata archaeon]